jgi:hypothetical protein
MAATFIVETGAGLSNANSYLSLTDANTYHENHSGSTTWTSAAQADKEKALRLATQYLDAKYYNLWKGSIYTDSQALAWPRIWAEKNDCYATAYYDSDALPQQLKDATAELALKIIEGDTLLDDITKPGDIKSKSVTVGPISKTVVYVGGSSNIKSYPLIEKLMRPLLTSGTLERG